MHTPRLVYSNSRINNLLITGFHTANNNNTGSCNLSTVYVLFYFPGGAFSPYKKLAQQVEVLLKKPPQLLRPCYLLSHTCEVFTTRKYAALRTPGSELKKYDITTLGAFRTFTNIPGPGIRTASFAAFGAWSGVLPKNAGSLGTAMRSCASLFRGVAAPLGCVICLQLGDVAVFSLCAQYFLNVRGGGGITTLGAFHTVRKPCVARG